MRTITALKPQKRSKSRVNVFLDGKFAFGMAFQIAHNLNVGQKLSGNDVVRLQVEDEVEKAHDKVLVFLAHRPRSEAEVSTRLSRHGFPKEVAQTVLQRLRTVGLVDDTAFAAFWVGNRSTFRPRGLRALRAELLQKGVSDEVIESVLEDVNQQADARRAADKRVARLRDLPERERRRKLREFLARRGFEYDIISDVIDKLMAEEYDNED